MALHVCNLAQQVPSEKGVNSKRKRQFFPFRVSLFPEAMRSNFIELLPLTFIHSHNCLCISLIIMNTSMKWCFTLLLFVSKSFFSAYLLVPFEVYRPIGCDLSLSLIFLLVVLISTGNFEYRIMFTNLSKM